MSIRKRKVYHKQCVNCNKKFTHIDKRQKICSRECYIKYSSRPLIKKICKFCGKEFLDDRNHHNIIFCSNSCAIKNNWKLGKYTKEVQKKMGINGGRARKGKIRVKRIKKICPICGKEFSHVPNYARQVTFCSFSCAAKERRKHIIFPVKDTSIEIKIQNFLKQLNIDFLTHQYIKKIEHGYQCDILIPSMNLVIECDGNYWHKYPIGREIDNIRTSELIEQGFKVLRLWEFEIKKMELEDFQNRILL